MKERNKQIETSTFDIYEAVTQKFVKAIESGVAPWQNPWISPQNLVSRKPYRGVNALLLAMADFESPYWVTFKQAKELGGSVKKGGHGEFVVFYKFVEKHDAAGNEILDEKGNAKTIPMLRYYHVFNIAQTDGIEIPAMPQRDMEPVEAAKRIMESSRTPTPEHHGFSAYYSPGSDKIVLPPADSFRTAEAYYRTWFHEAVHSTGSAARLNRPGVTGVNFFGSAQYGKEELIAELGSAFLANEAGILTDQEFNNGASYLASWLKAIKEDAKLIVHAAGGAQRAVDYILNAEGSEGML